MDKVGELGSPCLESRNVRKTWRVVMPTSDHDGIKLLEKEGITVTICLARTIGSFLERTHPVASLNLIPLPIIT